jgi:uncharacterized protein
MRLPAPAPPDDLGRHHGLAYAEWLPPGPPRGGIVILHGAGSRKESHYDFGRAARAAGYAALAFDLPGHGASDGPMDGGVLDDVAAMAALLPPGPVALRGSSLGGFLALAAARRAGARAVIAICPADSALLLQGLRSGRFDFDADAATLGPVLEEVDLERVAAALDAPLLLLHAEGDESVPVASSRALAAAAGDRARLIVTPGGHHRAIQHDAELQGESLRFLDRAFAAQPRPA